MPILDPTHADLASFGLGDRIDKRLYRSAAMRNIDCDAPYRAPCTLDHAFGIRLNPTFASNASAPTSVVARARAIDTHAHWYPAEWLHVFERDGPAEGARLERTANGYVIRTERIVNAFDEQFVDLDLRLE